VPPTSSTSLIEAIEDLEIGVKPNRNCRVEDAVNGIRQDRKI
jgi:hypothetical protein